MRRRKLLAIGAASAALLALAGGVASLGRPGLEEGRLSPGAREVLAALGRAMLDGTLPGPPAQHAAIAGLLERVERLVAALPGHAKGELSQLLALLASEPGRRMFAGLSAHWPEATVAQLQQALQEMRFSSLALRQQAYLALHDIVGAAWFADPATWAAIGYPGPAPMPA